MRGHILVIVFFVVTGVSVVLVTKLHDRFDYYARYLELQSTNENLKQEKAQSDSTAALLKSILSGVHIDELHMLRLSVMCGDHGDEVMSQWHRILPGTSSSEVVRFDSAKKPLPVAQVRRTYRFGTNPIRDAFLSVDVELAAEGVLVGQLNIDDAYRLDTACNEFVRQMTSPVGPDDGDMADATNKVFR